MCNLATCNHDDLDDSLDDFFADFDRSRPTAANPLKVVASKPVEDTLHYEPCKKCGGSGRFVGYTGRVLGNCFACKGAGKLGFKQDADTRAKARASEATRKEKAKVQNLAGFLKEHEAEVLWMTEASGRGFDFASSMLQAVTKYGSLTERQLSAVRNCMAEDVQRAAKRAADAKAAEERLAAAPVIDITRIADAMQNAMDKGIKRPLLRLAGYKFSFKEGGVIYIRNAKDSDIYYGKIVDGKFVKVRSCSQEDETAILEVAADPAAAAVAYGRRTGECACCGRELTNHASIELGIGPICAGKYGF